MKFTQVFERCKEKGIQISREGLYLAGLKYGFIERCEGKRNIFHKEEFENWVAEKLKPIPVGYFTVIECSKKLNRPLSTMYFFIKEGNIKMEKMGKGVNYVKLEELEKYIYIREHGSEEEYGN